MVGFHSRSTISAAACDSQGHLKQVWSWAEDTAPELLLSAVFKEAESHFHYSICTGCTVAAQQLAFQHATGGGQDKGEPQRHW